MCGVAGLVRHDGAPVDTALVAAMTARLQHRGPDEAGSWHDHRVGLGHRRLSIIDLGGSAQPMSDGRWHVVFNGELFNFRELRRSLRHRFRTDGDTEVVLAAFAERGLAAVRDFRGQFAFAAYDSLTGTTWLVRDRLGVLPLHHVQVPGGLAFASEVKALLPALPGGVPQVDLASLDAYLSARSVAAPHTLFEGVRKVPPGCALELSSDGRVVEHRWWDFPDADEVLDVSPAEATGLVSAALERAVERCLVADVPVGAYLSGGVDSSLITALMVKASGGRVRTFAAGFGDARHDETGHARAVSEHLGTEHTEVVVTPGDFTDLWSRLTWFRDAPLSEPADVAVHKLAQLAGRDVKVVLSGEGSDELFAGYPKYRAAPFVEAVGVLPAGARAALAGRVERRLPPSAARFRVALRAAGARDADARRRAWFSPFTEDERRVLLGDAPVRSRVRSTGSKDVVRDMLLEDCRGWLADNLLERGDRMTMAASIELRPPFLDHDLVDLAFRLPTSVKVHRGTSKWVVKQVAASHLPAAVVERPKSGFKVPLDLWFRGGLRDMSWDLLTGPSSFAGDVFDRSAVRSLLERHDVGRSDEHIRIWTLLSLEVWHRTFFGHDRAVPASGGAAAVLVRVPLPADVP